MARKRIAGAFVVGFGLVGIAFVMNHLQTPLTTSDATGLAVVTESAGPRPFIAVSDADADGIPDWQEALQRTEPVQIDQAQEEYEIPDTLTDQFALDFFQSVVRSKNYGAFGSDPTELVEQATNQLDSEAKDTLFTLDDLTLLNDDSPEAIRLYVNALAGIALDYTLPANAPTEIEILKRAYDTNNPDVLLELDPYVTGYTNMVTRINALAVPSRYASAHLDLLNAYNAVKNDIASFQLAFSDPLYTIIRLKRFEEDVTAMHLTILNMQVIVTEANIEFLPTDPVIRLLGGITNVGT